VSSLWFSVTQLLLISVYWGYKPTFPFRRQLCKYSEFTSVIKTWMTLVTKIYNLLCQSHSHYIDITYFSLRSCIMSCPRCPQICFPTQIATLGSRLNCVMERNIILDTWRHRNKISGIELSSCFYSDQHDCK